jgi:ubiquinone/menaquinone biosynthesis C-methylase UbiE
LNNGQAHLANALALPYADDTFDIINFTDILEHLFDPLRGLREANRVLKKGGYLMIDTPNRAYINIKTPFLGSNIIWGLFARKF